MMLQAQRRWLVYKCTTGPVCGQVFLTGGSLKRHQTIYHLGTAEWSNSFCCSLCNQEFEVLSALEAHAMQHYKAGGTRKVLKLSLESSASGGSKQRPRPSGTGVRTGKASRSIVSVPNDAKGIESPQNSPKTAQGTAKSAQNLAQSMTKKCGLGAGKSLQSVTTCAFSSSAKPALSTVVSAKSSTVSSAQAEQLGESSVAASGATATQNVLTSTVLKTVVAPTPLAPQLKTAVEPTAYSPQTKTAYNKPMTHTPAGGNLTTGSPAETAVKTGKTTVQTSGGSSGNAEYAVQQQNSGGIAAAAFLQSLEDSTRSARYVTQMPAETRKIEVKSPVLQKRKYKTGGIRAFTGEMVISTAVIVTSVKQLDSCEGRGLLICQACGQVYVSVARIREHLVDHPKCGKCSKCFFHEFDVAEHVCPPEVQDVIEEPTTHSDAPITTVELNDHCETISSNSADTSQCLAGFNSAKTSTGTSSHHLVSGSKTSSEPRELTAPAETSFVSKKVPGVGGDVSPTPRATTSDQPTPANAVVKTCPACSTTFPSNEELLKHTLTHKPTLFFQCTTCDDIFVSRSAFADHLSKCESWESWCSCSTCNKPFSSSKGLRVHQLRHHSLGLSGGAGSNVFSCPECEQVFNVQKAYVSHLIKHAVLQNRSDPKSLQCRVCSSTFYTSQALQKHMKCHETDAPSDPIACLLCSETFESKRALISHQKKHFYCQFCDANFTDRAELGVHNREKHQNERPWTCSLCNASYRCRFDLTRHKLKHEGRKFYACGSCGQDFYASADLKQHEASVHSAVPRSKPFMCGQCGKRFFTRGHLNTHRRSHSTLQPFHCPHCPVRCKTNKNLEIHVRRHTGELPIKCKVCFGGRSFHLFRKQLGLGGWFMFLGGWGWGQVIHCQGLGFGEEVGRGGVGSGWVVPGGQVV